MKFEIYFVLLLTVFLVGTNSTISKAESNLASLKNFDKKGGACKEVVGPNTKYEPNNLSNFNVISPEFDAIYSFVKNPAVYNKAEFDGLMNGVQVAVVVSPKHGKLMPVQVTDDKIYKGYFYMAEPGYFGVDKVVFSIKFGNGKTILLNNLVSVVGSPSMGEPINACPDTSSNYQWMRDHKQEIKKAWQDFTGSKNE
jgi:hypothetical protein